MRKSHSFVPKCYQRTHSRRAERRNHTRCKCCKRSSEIVVFGTFAGGERHHRAEGAVIRPIIAMGYSCERVAATETAPIDGLRPRRCLNPDCNAVFALCRSCDRGQRYCSDPCRKRMRRRQVLAAGHRYQASQAGKEAHRHRQCTYRQRRSQAAVTHQSPVSFTISSPTPPARLTKCTICGRSNRWMNPFYWLPGTRRRPRPSPSVGQCPKSYVIT
jgi:hypothetical protein